MIIRVRDENCASFKISIFPAFSPAVVQWIIDRNLTVTAVYPKGGGAVPRK